MSSFGPLLLIGCLAGAAPAVEADVVLRGALLVDGSGSPGVERQRAAGRHSRVAAARLLEGGALRGRRGFRSEDVSR